MNFPEKMNWIIYKDCGINEKGKNSFMTFREDITKKRLLKYKNLSRSEIRDHIENKEEMFGRGTRESIKVRIIDLLAET